MPMMTTAKTTFDTPLARIPTTCRGGKMLLIKVITITPGRCAGMSRAGGEDAAIALLRKMGLTKVEAQIYMYLLAEGPSTLPKIAEGLSMHRPQVYTSLRRLVSKSVVESLGGKPAVFRAVDPEVIVKMFSQEISRLMSDALEKMKSIRSRGGERSVGIWLMRSYEGALAKAESLIEKATVDMAVCGSPEFIMQVAEKLYQAEERGVNVYVLVYSPPGVEFSREKLEKLRKVRWAVSGDTLVVIDSRLGVLTQRRGVSPAAEYGLIIEEPVILDYILHDFFSRWLRSRVICDRRVRLPTKFTMHRLALLEASRLADEGVRLRARIRGRWVRSGKPMSIEGELVKPVIDLTTGLAHFIVKARGKLIKVGGPDAIVEDGAAHLIELASGGGGEDD
ncbi:MAG: hypothetical protein DRN99_04075 [Thermoproteota archaeon]|nr:MAG: hypothetical protein DRN99_04075 [Candidatus Korarchaeota archaeon]